VYVTSLTPRARRTTLKQRALAASVPSANDLGARPMLHHADPIHDAARLTDRTTAARAHERAVSAGPMPGVSRARRWPELAGGLRVRRARTDAEVLACATAYRSASGYEVSREYLRRASVYVALKGGEVVGGFVLNTQPPFRTVLRLPEAEQARLAPHFPKEDTVELACVWLAPAVRGPGQSATLWAALVWHAGRQDRSHVVFRHRGRPFAAVL
jgi:hypothetical protein